MAQGATLCISLALKGPLHIGHFIGVDREAVEEWVPADTLFGALVNAWALTGQDVEALLKGFKAGDPPFLLTSAFPQAGAVRFYPRPWLRPHLPADALSGKRTKRLRWVSEGILTRLVNGHPLHEEVQEDNFLQGNTVWLTHTERAQLPASVHEWGRAWGYQAVPHVTVSRTQARSNLFHTGRVDFAHDCGLWFAVRYRADRAVWHKRLCAALNYLAEAGLGGLRSIGHGAFEWREEECPLPAEMPTTGEFALTLSRYAPRSAEELQTTLLEDPRTAYTFTLVGGWCHDSTWHTWRRRSVRLVSEGSLLRWPAQEVVGHLVDVTPENAGEFRDGHRVWRYGFAFPMPVASSALEEVST